METSLLQQERSFKCLLRENWLCSVLFLHENYSIFVMLGCRTLQLCTAEDVTSQTDTLLFVFLSNLQCGFSRSSFILSSPTHVSLCHKTSLSFLFLYKCLQYLMEVKKAQQSLESTYKQLDYVSRLLKCVDRSK